MIAHGAEIDADEHPGDAHPQEAHDQREPAAVRVGDDARRNLEEEHGSLHRGSHEDELQRRQVELAHEVDRHHDPRRHREQQLEPVVDGRRR